MEVKTVDEINQQTTFEESAEHGDREEKTERANEENTKVTAEENQKNTEVVIKIESAENMETSPTGTDAKIEDLNVCTHQAGDIDHIDKVNTNSTNKIAVETEKAIENTDIKKEATETEKEKPGIVVKKVRKRTRPPKNKRMKLQKIMTKDNVQPIKVAETEQNMDMSTEVTKEDVEYCLTVSNLPNSWSFMEIKNYIDTQCGPVDEIEMIKNEKTDLGAIRLSYQTDRECQEAMEKLKNKEVAGNKLVLEISVVNLESGSETKSDTTETNKHWKPDLDSWEVDLQGMYGLKLQYLRSLGITPPLDKWVHVSNFRCDKSELRDVMEMAGNVQMCSVFMSGTRYANVMFSHPLEAVQAVSMLNNQMFYGQQLKVALDRSPNNTILIPKGLSSIGKGLGLNGKPLRNIVKHYERFVENKDCLINPAIFDIPENHSMKINGGFESVKFEVRSVEEFNYPTEGDKHRNNASSATSAELVKTLATPKPATPKTKVQTPAFTMTPKPVSTPIRPASKFMPMQNVQQCGTFGPNFGPNPYPGTQMMNGQGMPGPQGPMVPQRLPGPQPYVAGTPVHYPQQYQCPPGPMQPVWGPGTGPMPMNLNEPVKLILSNLPPSTTFALLCEKMSQWGHVVCIQLTTPGCAVVTFANRMQADACFQYYNGRNIDNHFIQLKYA